MLFVLMDVRRPFRVLSETGIERWTARGQDSPDGLAVTPNHVGRRATIKGESQQALCPAAKDLAIQAY
jgi:hypothetical protein